jgi:hypothetical protein
MRIFVSIIFGIVLGASVSVGYAKWRDLQVSHVNLIIDGDAVSKAGGSVIKVNQKYSNIVLRCNYICASSNLKFDVYGSVYKLQVLNSSGTCIVCQDVYVDRRLAIVDEISGQQKLEVRRRSASE